MIGGDPPDGYPPQGLWVEDVAYDNDVVEECPVNGDAAAESGTEDVPGPGTENGGATNPPLDEYPEVQR